MDSSRKHVNPSPENSANFLSRSLFCWILPFFKQHYKRNLQLPDIYNSINQDKCDAYVNKLQTHWDKELELYKKGKRDKPSLKIAIFKTFIKDYSVYGFVTFLQAAVVKTLQPIVLAEYIKYFNNSHKYDTLGEYSGWILGTAVVLLAFFFALFYHHSALGCQRIGMRARAACSSLVYRKLLKLSQASLTKTPGGKLVNLLSNDLQRFDQCSMFLHYIWIMPIQAVICFYLMYNSVNIAAVAGVLVMAIEGIPMQGYFSKLQGRLRSKIAEKTDFRVKLMSELVAGIKVVKMYAWEKYFAKVVELARGKEVDNIYKTSQIKGVHCALMVITERFALFIIIVTFVLLGNAITADSVFTVAQLCNSVQCYMCIMFPNALITYAESKVSIRRLEKLLRLEEKVGKSTFNSKQMGCAFLENVTASWNGDDLPETISSVNLDISPGKLYIVVGTVGSGKTSLLQLLLGELPLKTGKLDVSGEFSYASQEPWLFVSSVRDNILFGKPYIKEKYEEVIRVCALETDLKQFQFGDKTIVEERGVSLSGGQRARLNLARAVYANADIYLLDDPLSAVDTRVGKHLFEKCIKGYLGNKTRILVTHQLQFLKDADVIIVLEQGKIHKIGTYSELSEQYLNLLNQNNEEHEAHQKDDKQSHISDINDTLTKHEEGPAENAEEVATGAIPFSTYSKYFGYGTNVFGFLIMILLFILAQLAANAGDLWLTSWVNQGSSMAATTTNDIVISHNSIVTADHNLTSNDPKYHYNIIDNNLPEEKRYSDETYMITYTVTIVLALILTPVRSLNFYRIIMKASKNLHHKMFGNVLEAPMRFFDTNPSGRILNRFSNDMGIVDELLPKALLEGLQIFLVLFGILLLVFIKVPWMIIPSILLGVLFYFLRNIFMKTTQDVKRLDGVTRAPVFSHLMATLDGMTTIRATKNEDMLIREFESLVDQNSSTWYLYIASSEVFGFYLDCISTVFIAIVTYQFLIFETVSSSTAGNVGLLLSQSLILTGMVQMGVRQTAEVANNMTSVERVLQYAELEKETEEKTELSTTNLIATYKTLNKDWPFAGCVEFRNVCLKYSIQDPPVLKNLNFVFNAGEKIGVVGRTGAGKSSLISALFRLSSVEGNIFIDGVDTSNIKLADLRSKISIIPQEPVLFSATVRYNLDPFNTVTDGQIWEALENVEMKNVIDDLQTEIMEGGSNFSTGQRQLMCLARAIVRNNKILVLDEATANVDPNTDILIQRTIRKNFRHCTVITIAHRLNTIMDSDKVLVMDAGQVVEFDHPHVLLKNPLGYFTNMLKETGTATEQALRKIAADHYQTKMFRRN